MVFYGSTYAQTLRAVGQDLEARHLEDFHLEYYENAFLVQGEERVQHQRLSVLQQILKAPRNRTILQVIFQVILRKLRPPVSRSLEIRYAALDVERLELEGQRKRRDPYGMPDFYSLPQVLRTAGAYVDVQNIRLLGLYKQGTRLTVEYEKVKGQRHTEERTIPSFYDFFLHMYLQRSGR